MSADFNQPTTSSNYTTLLGELKDRDVDIAKMFDGVTPSNITTGFKRWNSSALRFEQWNGTTWAPLASSYAINVTGSAATLTTPRTIALSGQLSGSTTFNGSADATINATVTSGTLTGQLRSNRAGSATTGDGQIYLAGATSNRIDFNTTGLGVPTVSTRSLGTKICLYPALSGSAVDYAMGLDATGGYWQSVASATDSFHWYCGPTLKMSMSNGNLSTTGSITAGTNASVGGNLSVTGSATIDGGSIVLNGTGRIQGIDTVSASTDATSKAYVDAAVAAGVGSGGDLTVNNIAVTEGNIILTGTGRIQGIDTVSASTDAANKSYVDAALVGDITPNSVTVTGGSLILGGTGRIQGIDTVSASTDAANKSYVDTAVTTALGGDITANSLAVTTGSIILNGTGRIQGIDTVSASTDAVSKSYVDGKTFTATSTMPLSTTIELFDDFKSNSSSQYGASGFIATVGAASQVLANQNYNYSNCGVQGVLSIVSTSSSTAANDTAMMGTVVALNAGSTSDPGNTTPYHVASTTNSRIYAAGLINFASRISGQYPIFEIGRSTGDGKRSAVKHGYVRGGGTTSYKGFGLWLDPATHTTWQLAYQNGASWVSSDTTLTATCLTGVNFDYLELFYDWSTNQIKVGVNGSTVTVTPSVPYSAFVTALTLECANNITIGTVTTQTGLVIDWLRYRLTTPSRTLHSPSFDIS